MASSLADVALLAWLTALHTGLHAMVACGRQAGNATCDLIACPWQIAKRACPCSVANTLACTILKKF